MMKFKLYKHKNNTDIAFMPLYNTDSEEFTNKIVKIGYWYNIVNLKNIYKCSEKLDIIEIQKEDLDNWEKING